MTEHTVYEPESVYDNLDAYNVGDTVEYISNNQEGYAKYVVYMDDGEKRLRMISDLYGDLDDTDNTLEGGKRRKRTLRKTLKKRTAHAKKRTAHAKRTKKHMTRTRSKHAKLQRKQKSRRLRK